MKESKMMIGGKKVEKGDWIVVGLIYGWSESGCVVDVNEEEVNMYDGKEGWSVDREEIVSVGWK